MRRFLCFVLVVLFFLVGCGGEIPEKQWFHVICYSDNGTAVFDEILYRDVDRYYYIYRTGKVVRLDLDCTYIEIDEPQ